MLETLRRNYSQRFLSPYRSINYLLQKSEAFQSVHHVSFILCYMIFFVSAAASVGTEQMSTGHLLCALIFSLIRVRKNLWEDITQGKV